LQSLHTRVALYKSGYIPEMKTNWN